MSAIVYKYESWTIEKAEHWRTDAFKLWCWRRCLRVPWTARRSNQSILKEINPECSLEGLILKLKLQSFGHLMWRADLLGKTLMLGKIQGKKWRGNRGWDGWTASLTQWTSVWANSRRQWRTGKPAVLLSMGSQRVRHDWVTEQQHKDCLWLSLLFCKEIKAVWGFTIKFWVKNTSQVLTVASSCDVVCYKYLSLMFFFWGAVQDRGVPGL